MHNRGFMNILMIVVGLILIAILIGMFTMNSSSSDNTDLQGNNTNAQ